MTATPKLPPPLVPRDVDLRHLEYMPLKIARLMTSKTWRACRRRPDLAFHHLNLWAAAYHQVPAGSLPDDDDELMDLARCDASLWPTVRPELMRTWVRCRDGRLYHPVVCEVALEGWQTVLDHRIKSFKMRRARAEKSTDMTPDEKTHALKEADDEIARLLSLKRAATLAARQLANQPDIDADATENFKTITREPRGGTTDTTRESTSGDRDATNSERDGKNFAKGREGTGLEGIENPKAAAVVSGTRAREAAAGRNTDQAQGGDPPPPPSPAAPKPPAQERTEFHREKTIAMQAEAARIGPIIAEAAGIDPARSATLTWAPVEGWLRGGCDLELHVLPAVRRVVARPGYRPPNTLKYFTEAIIGYRREVEEGAAAFQAPTPSGPRQPDATALVPAWLKRRCAGYTVAQAEKRWKNWHNLFRPHGQPLDEGVAWTLLATGLQPLADIVAACPLVGRDPHRKAVADLGKRVAAGEDCTAVELEG